MDITEESIKPILEDFYHVTREVQISRYDRNHRKYQVRNANLDVLNAFFRSVRVSFEEPEKRNTFQSSVELYLQRLQSGLLNEADIKSAINNIIELLKDQKNNILYNRFLSILSEYKML